MDTSSYIPEPTTIKQDVSCRKANETPAFLSQQEGAHLSCSAFIITREGPEGRTPENTESA